jgi:hypothetical protein
MDAAVLAKEFQLDEAVGIGFENDATPVASLSNVFRSIEGNHPSETCHDEWKVRKWGSRLKETSRLSPVSRCTG